MLGGTVTVEVGHQSVDAKVDAKVDAEVDAEVGDAVSFPGDVNHSYANHREEPVRFALAVHEPGVGTAARGTHHA